MKEREGERERKGEGRRFTPSEGESRGTATNEFVAVGVFAV